MMPRMGHPYLRLGIGNEASSDDDRFPTISPDFEENHGQSMSLQSDPFLLANRG